MVGNITTTVKKMDKLVSAADANRRFSELLRGVREGQSFLVTAHGKPVARLVPAGKDDTTAAGTRKALLARLRAEPIVTIGRWTRDELYEDVP
jgi:prevent-host-death family protein